MIKKSISFLMALIMLMTCFNGFTLTVSAATFSGGSGTEADPYLISTYDDLAAMRDAVNDGTTTYEGVYFKLTQDIGLYTKTWKPIGVNTTSKYFAGTFDGGEYSIRGLKTVENTSGSYNGLFGVNTGTIKKLTVLSEYTTNCKYSAILCGYNKGKIYNCYTEGTLTADNHYVGGICGKNCDDAIVEGCGNEATISAASYMCVGGICGITEGDIKRCYNSGKITGNIYVGGICGEIGTTDYYDSTYILNCINTAEVSKDGGICGNCSGYGVSTIRNCLNRGTINGGQGYGISASSTPGLAYNYYLEGTCLQGRYNKEDSDTTSKRLTLDELSDKSNFVDWDFNNTWCMYYSNPVLLSKYLRNGSGTSRYPYLINNLDDLETLCYVTTIGSTPNTYEGAYIKLMADIDMSEKYNSTTGESWKAISFLNSFMGNFNGNNHTISGLYATGDYSSKGLFCTLGESGTIRNLTVEGYVNQTHGNYSSILCANNKGTISNCTAKGILNGKPPCGGGICGYNSGTIENCINYASVELDLVKYGIGGIVGYCINGNMKNCRNFGNIKQNECENTYSRRIGGIVGSWDNSEGEISNCYNVGTVTGVNADSNIGGIVGYWNNTSYTVKNCCNIGAVTGGENSYIGGIVGNNYSSSSFEDCYYLDTCVSGGSEYGTSKTSAQFASGEVAYLLQGVQDTQYWGQTIGTDSNPDLTSDSAKKVYKVTFNTKDSASGEYTEYAAAYANSGGTVALPEAPTSDITEFVKWSKTTSTSGTEFTAATEITEDTDVYAVGEIKYGEVEGEHKVTTTYGTEATQALTDYVAMADGSTSVTGKFTYSITDGAVSGITISGENLKVASTTNAGTYNLTITAKKKSTDLTLMAANSNSLVSASTDGTVTFNVTVEVNAKSISECTVTGINSSYTYTGSEIKPTVTVKDNSTTLKKDTDYTVGYSSNTNAGTATVTITGKGNYSNEINQTFTISQAAPTLTQPTPSAVTYGTKLSAITLGDNWAWDNGDTVPTVTNSGYTAYYTVSDYTNYDWSGIDGYDSSTHKVTRTITVKVNAKALTDSMISAIENQTYTGSEIKPDIMVTDSEAAITADDYTVSYSNNTNVGTAKVTITGKNNYTGTASKNFIIGQTAAEFTQPIPEAVTYGAKLSAITLGDNWEWENGSITPTVVNSGYTAYYTVTDYTNYDWSKIDGYDSSTHKVTRTITVKVNAKTLTDDMISAIENQTYTGSEITPTVTVTDSEAEITADDYTVSYKDNIDVGTATVTITGKNNYTGTASKSFTISPKAAEFTQPTPDTVTYGTRLSEIALGDNWAWDDGEILPTVTNSGYTAYYTVTDYTHYDWTNVEGYNTETHKVTRTITVNVNAKALTNGMVSDIADQTYTGSEITPAVTVTDSEATITADDYTVSYSENINVGTATVTITGKGNYTGTVSKNFIISQTAAEFTQPTPDAVTYGTKLSEIALGNNWAWDDGEILPTVTNSGYTAYYTLTDYDVNDWTGVEGYDAETHKVKRTISVTVNPKALTDDMIGNIADRTYTGDAITPDVVVTDTILANTVTLVVNTDYTVAYENNTDAGTGTVKVTGTGNYTGTAEKSFSIVKSDFTFDSSTGEITGYTGSGGSIVVPSTYNGMEVTGIGKNAFKDCTSITSVTIPDSVTSIGDAAFRGCSGLTSLTIPENVTAIGNYAFYGCSGLTSLTIPENVTAIGNYAFDGCSGLKGSVKIPDGITTISRGMFCDCSSLTGITLPNNVTSVGSDAFNGCSSLKNITIPKSVTVISEYAFYKCSKFTSVEIPNSVESIGKYAFSSCTGITSVTIPDSVTSVGTGVFSTCTNLTSVTISKSLATISNRMFLDCSNLTSVTIPEKVTYIDAYAFSGCSRLTSVTMPNSVESIGHYAFKGCTSMTSVIIPDSVITIGSNTFYGCTSLTDITIPNSVTSIDGNAFYGCSKLTSVTMSNSVESIGGHAFYNCPALKGSITLPVTVTSVGRNAFSGCSNLDDITVLSKEATIEGGAFNKVKKLRCFKDSTASSFTPSSGTAPTIVYIQEQGSLDISIPKLDGGKWIQRVEIVVYKDSGNVTQELTYYKDGDGAYIFPTAMTADVYLGGDVSLPYEVYYYYNYDETPVENFSEWKEASEDIGEPSDMTQLYRKKLETTTSNVDISLVELG